MNKFNKLIFIDDDAATNVYHRIIIEESDFCESYIFFNSALKALAYFRSLVREDILPLPDAIFLDINMPVMDGWEFIEAYKSIDLPASPIVIMLTTSLLGQDLQRAEDTGIVHKIIQKPLSEELMKSLYNELSVNI